MGRRCTASLPVRAPSRPRLPVGAAPLRGAHPAPAPPAGVVQLPDWGKLIFHEQPPSDLGAALGPAAPPEAVELVAGLLQYNPELRLTAEQALRSPWFTQEPLPAGPEAVLAEVRRVLAD